MERIDVLGVPVDVLNMDRAVRVILGWAEKKEARYVCIRDVHGVIRAHDDPEIMAIHERADLVTPDGMPLVWLGRLRGHEQMGRVSGSDLVDAVCASSVGREVGHFFIGGKPGVADKMAGNLAAKYPGLRIAGTLSPPFTDMTPAEAGAIEQALIQSGASIIWVGLGTPKQELWMRDHVGRIPGATLIGVGAAFDFQAGNVPRAPRWMQRSGLEWVYRVMTEPRRLWKRYLLLAPRFIYLLISASLKNVLN